MNEIYWISRLDFVSGFLLFCSITSGIILCISIVGRCCNNKNDEREAYFYRNFLKTFYWALSIFLISIPSFLFIPNSRQMLMIYGVGGTIDYIKENPTAKQLPDKCIKALDTWVDNVLETKEKNKEDINQKQIPDNQNN